MASDTVVQSAQEAGQTETVVHPSAVVEAGAELGAGVRIGPFCHVGSQVKLGDGCELVGHVSIAGDTSLGEGARVFPFASIGHEPQDLKYAGEPVQLTIGARCMIREGVTMNPGTGGGGGVTRVGDDCTFLANSHVAHDCIVGNRVIFSNNVMLAGHCVVGDAVIFGGGSAAHQFCRIGHHAFIGGLAGVEGDLIPFGMAIGNRANLSGLNLIGMKRMGLERASIHAVRGAFKELFDGSAPVQQRAAQLKVDASDALVIEMLDFVLAGGDRALCTPST